MKTTTQKAPNIIASLLVAHGVRRAVVSPGTRNAPLIVALAAVNEIVLTPVADERQAGFVALGMARREGSPVALICTSGTALLNYAPAIAEAFYSKTPLIVISADRPSRWIDQNEGQTIRQYGALANIVKASYDISSDTDSCDYDWVVNRKVNEALIEAISDAKGPVHINVQLDMPLGEVADIVLTNTQKRIIRSYTPRGSFSLAELRDMLNGLPLKRLAVVVGFQTPDVRINKALARLSCLPNVAIFTEAQSNVRGVKTAVSALDATLSLLTCEEKEKYKPDLIISFGGGIMSPELKNWLRNCSCEVEHWYVGSSIGGGIVDCYQNISRILRVDTATFLNTLTAALRREKTSGSDYNSFWETKTHEVNELTSDFLRNSPWCDMVATNAFFENIPATCNLQISNGMAIRYAQLCHYERLHRIDCNRGCNGIDGSISTAIGAAIDCNRPTVLLTGDTSANYDIGALSMDCIPPNLSIFILNNRGGDIFRFIRNTRNLEIREKYLSMAHSADYQAIAEAFGFGYVYANNIKDLGNACRLVAHPSERPLFVEIDTSASQNAEIFRQYFLQLKKDN